MARRTNQIEDQTQVSTDRYSNIDPNQVLSVAPVLPYHEIVDIGCGEGYFSIPLGKHLFDGRVYAVDERQESLDAVKEQLDRIRLTNVELKLFQGSNLPLDDESVDGAIIAFYLNQSSDRQHLLQEAHRCLRRGGWIVVLEWFKRDMPVGPPVEQRLDVSDLREVMQEAGFRYGSRHDLNNRQYMLVMRK